MAQLQTSERTLRIFVEYVPAAVAILDRDMNYIAVSRQFVEEYRPAIADLIGRSHYEAFPEIPEHWREVHRHCLQGSTWKVSREPFVRADGAVQWVESELRPWYDEAGEVGGLVLYSETVTEQVLAQDALRESEERYRLLFETMAHGVLIQETDGRLTQANPAAERILGLAAVGLDGRNARDPRWRTIFEDGSAFPVEEYPSTVALRTGHPVHNVVMGIVNQDDGAYRWLSIHAVPRFRPGGDKPFQVFTTFEDITERKQAELDLRLSEEKYRGLLSGIDSAVSAVDAAGRFLYMNERAAADLGGRTQELIGKTMGDLFPPFVAARQLESIRTVIRTDTPFVAETQSVVQGAPRWYRTSIQPIHDEHAHVAYALLVSTDIDAQKSLQEELRQLNRTLEARVAAGTAEVQDLYDNAPAGYHSLDAQGRIVRINQTELDWLGRSREEVLGRPIVDFVTPASRAAFAERFQTFLETGAVRDLEFELLRKDGSTIDVLVSATATYDAEGTLIASRSTVYDNTERKQAEEALRRAHAEMARAVRLKDEFLANMSHELRTPLTGILALGENLQEQLYGPLNERQLKTLRHIESSSRHLLALINDLLDLSKIEAGRLELAWEQVVVDDACRASLLFVKELALKKGIDLQYHNEQVYLVLRADVLRLKQMLVNLLSNAVKFTSAGGRVTLTVLASVHDQQIRFIVEDTGIGIAPADQPRLFQPFTQLDAALTRKYEGTGLGLAMVKRLAAEHGGSVAVESRGVPGEGSRFTITLPYTVL